MREPFTLMRLRSQGFVLILKGQQTKFILVSLDKKNFDVKLLLSYQYTMK